MLRDKCSGGEGTLGNKDASPARGWEHVFDMLSSRIKARFSLSPCWASYYYRKTLAIKWTALQRHLCLCSWRAVNAALQNRRVWLTKPSEINSINCEKLSKLEKMCVTSFLLMGYIRLSQKQQWLVLWTLHCSFTEVLDCFFVCLTWGFLCYVTILHEGKGDFFFKMMIIIIILILCLLYMKKK